jgi:cytochrome c
MIRILTTSFVAAAMAAGGTTVANGASDDHHEAMGRGVTSLVMPEMNSKRGMTLFVEKGCVACHAANGVGGHDATPLDAHGMAPEMNPFEFAAKMWRMAPFMIEAQEEALGEQILFTGDELADIIAFIHDDAQQHHLTEKMLSPRIRKMMKHHHGDEMGEHEHMKETGHDHSD